MALPAEVNDVRISQDVSFKRTGDLVAVKVVTFMVQEHGPFRIEIPTGEYSVELVERMVNREVSRLRELGVLKTGQAQP